MSDSLRILFVEDSESDYLLTKQLLDSYIEVTRAKSIAEATAFLADNKYHVILLDLGMPDAIGLETLDKIIAAAGFQPAIIVFTGHDDEKLAKEALLRGAQDYLVKGDVDKNLLSRSIKYAIERQKSDLQLRESNAKLAHARDVALTASRLKSEFLANVSHELRTPLSGIVTVSELMIGEEDSDAIKEYVEILNNSSRRLMQAINELLDYSKLEAGKASITVAVSNLRVVIEESIASIAPTAKRKNLELKAVFETPIPESLLIDESRIRQIVMNLVHNAVKFTEKGEVVVSVSCDECSMTVSVRDTGIGISRANLYSIFEPFVQVDGSSSRRYEGTGLGLAICQRSVELLGGDIKVASEEGKGSTFSVTLPVVTPEEASSSLSKRDKTWH